MAPNAEVENPIEVPQAAPEPEPQPVQPLRRSQRARKQTTFPNYETYLSEEMYDIGKLMILTRSGRQYHVRILSNGLRPWKMSLSP